MNNLIVLNQNDNVGVSQFIIPEKTKIEGHDIDYPIDFKLAEFYLENNLV